MLIEPDKWRQLQIKQHVEALALAHPSKMYTSDEMALNLIFRGQLTKQFLSEKPRIWHFNTCKPIVHLPLTRFYNWLAFFNARDQILLKELENICQTKGTAAMLAIKSEDYNQF